MNNRVIKFRAWDGDEMIYDEYMIIYFGDNGYGIETEKGERYNVILMQYTGLKDKNGKDIYCGDVVKHSFADYEEKERPDLYQISIVRFGIGTIDASDYEQYEVDICGFYLEHNDNKEKGYARDSIATIKNIEVIGNIYEHSHLLK